MKIKVLRSPIPYHGSKGKLAKWISSLAPPAGSYTHRNYACAGGLDELFGADWPLDNVAETANDKSLRIYNLWHVIASPNLFAEFAKAVAVLPFHEYSLQTAVSKFLVDGYAPAIRDAVCTWVVLRMSAQGVASSGFRTPTRRLRGGIEEHVSGYLSAVEMLPEVHARLRTVHFRCMDACAFIRKLDHDKAFFYIDPPYVDEIRTSGGGEYLEDDFNHAELLRLLPTIRGKFLLSGYMSTEYQQAAVDNGWNVYSKLVDKHSSRASVKPMVREYLWRNY